MLECINGKMKYKTNTNLETLYIYIYMKPNIILKN